MDSTDFDFSAAASNSFKQQQDIRQFPFRIPLRPQESGRAYLLRAAECLGFSSVSNLLKFAGITWSQLYDANSVKKLSQLLRLENSKDLQQQMFVYASSQDEFGSVMFLGHPIPARHLNKTNPRICPRCLAEQEFCSAVWELVCVTDCPFHGCQMLDRCSNCGDPIKWLRPGVSVCRCGHDFRWEGLTPSKWSSTECMRLIYSAVGYVNHEKLPSTQLQFPELARNSLAFLLDLVPRLVSALDKTCVSIPVATCQS